MKIQYFAIFDISVLSEALSSERFALNTVRAVDDGNIVPVCDKNLLVSYSEALPKAGHSADDVRGLLYSIAKHGIIVNDLNDAREKALEKDGVPFFDIKALPDDAELKDDSFIVSPKIAVCVMNRMQSLAQSAGEKFEERINQSYRETLEAMKIMAVDEKDGLIEELLKQHG